MFTVIICDKAVIKDCTSKYNIHLKPLLDNKDYAFCSWNPQGETLGEAVPDLRKIISIKKEWRAFILADHHTEVLNHDKVNPFDVVEYKRIDKKLSAKEDVEAYREYVKESVDKAVANPLIKLSIWLGGAAMKDSPVAPDEDMTMIEPLSEEYEEIRKRFDCSVLDFETTLARRYRFKRISEQFELSGELFNPPKNIIAITDRSADTEYVKAAAAWKNHTEFDYSNFIEDNLYSNRFRCAVYGLPRVKGMYKEHDYFRFLVTMMIMAQQEIQSDVMKFGKLYEIETLVDDDKIGRICNEYLYKLHLTRDKLEELKYCHLVESKKFIDDAQAEREFESETPVMVNIDRAYDKETLMGEYKEIGLSKDCPGDEESYWNSQYSRIKKHFNRFLRQPQRCLEKTVETDFRRIEDIDVAKARRLNKFQREDVLFKLYEEEQKMLETATSKIYNKAKYDMVLSEANKNVLDGMSRRMSKKSTIFASLIPIVLFLIGFIPLFINEFNNFGTFSISVIMTATCLGLLIISILVTLFAFRKQIVKRIKGFNGDMGGIYDNVTDSLGQFSEYLTHAGNVMKSFAVLNAYEDRKNDLMKVYKKHEIDIDNRMTAIMELFSDYVDDRYVPDGRTRAYNYDFDQPHTYVYELPYEKTLTEIEFLQGGNIVSVPVDFIKSIKLRREELYD